MKSTLRLACIYLAVGGTAVAAGSTVINFDDLPSPGTGVWDIPQGYAGLNWSFLTYEAPGLKFAPDSNGFVNGVASSPHIAVGNGGNLSTFSIASGTFTFNSVSLTAAYNDNLGISVKGSLNGATVYQDTRYVDTTIPSKLDFNWGGIDSVIMRVVSLGTPHGYPIGSGIGFAVDDIDLTVIPEPSSYAVAGIGAAALMIIRRRK
jgi:hypothetical protein